MESSAIPLPASPTSDEALVQRIRGGERALFEVLVRRNNQRLYRAIRAVVSDETAVEEAMQQTYVIAFQKLDQFAHQAQFSTWLLRIGLNEGLLHLRRSRRWELVQGELSAEESAMKTAIQNPEQQAQTRQTGRLLEAILQTLPEIYRLALVLREVEGLSTVEAAEVLGITEDAVKQRLSRARALLRERLEERTGEGFQEVFQIGGNRCDRIVAEVFSALPQTSLK